MKQSGAMIWVVALSVSLTACSLFTSVDACKNVPVMSWSDACLKVCPTPALYNLCQETLQHAPDTAEATVYAATAAAAAGSYGATTDAAEELLLFGSLPAAERAAAERCLYKLAMARGRMVAVADGVRACDFGSAVEDYSYAAAAVDSCASALAPFPSSPLVALNAADRDATKVAVDLGSLVIW